MDTKPAVTDEVTRLWTAIQKMLPYADESAASHLSDRLRDIHYDLVAIRQWLDGETYEARWEDDDSDLWEDAEA